jgi:type III restriction enzyme
MKKKGFVFDRNLRHQKKAVESIVKVFDNLPIFNKNSFEANFVNPVIDYKKNFLTYKQNILNIQRENQISFDAKPTFSNIIDIMMETGTGKTYTYTKAIFELNEIYGIFKFIIIVPTLSIKAGTINFLKSESARIHFKEEYNKTISLYVVESQKKRKNKKEYMPSPINEFVRADKNDKNKIDVLIINAGMLNSETLKKSFDKTLFDKYTKPIDALAATHPFVIIDEPHRFAQENKTWQNIKLLNPQFILRFGATFKEYENLIYTLTAVDAFNQNLVKGIITHIEDVNKENIFVRLVNTDGKEATFEMVDNKKKKEFKLIKKEELKKIHPNFEGLIIENLNKSEVLLSNGLSLKKGDKINPFSYSETLQETMIKKAVENHFKIERELMTRKPRIKPISLFFIDNIKEYRNKDGYIKRTIEESVKAVAQKYLETETDEFYRNYLKKTVEDVEATHAGYYSEDNSVNDEKIEKEINEILHEKEKLLDINNTRRFIFSKWTLREGWDNPNVFQICKLRSSGSEISKLQEVGRGLRLPVNEYMSRVKDEEFYLHYYVDFTEKDFAKKLRDEVNKKSNAISKETVPDKLSDEMIKRILEKYPKFNNEDELLELLDRENVITRSNAFKEGGFEYIKSHFPLIFDGVNSNKIKEAKSQKYKVKARIGKYPELKELWEELNQKAVLEYKIKDEEEFKNLFREFLLSVKDKMNKSSYEKETKMEIEDRKAVLKEKYLKDNTKVSIITMSYHQFLKELSASLKANPKTLHAVFKELKDEFNINEYLNASTIRMFKGEFDKFLFYQSMEKFGIEYEKIIHSVHPTKLTYENGEPREEIEASFVGINYSNEDVAENYYFEELFYDSELEKENIITQIDEVIVFTKIPKNSVKIPVAGGGTYSPDFAYVLKNKDGEEKLYFVLEAKNVESSYELRKAEIKKIKHAEKFFKDKVKFKFETQFSNQKIMDLIYKILRKES